MNTKVIPVKTVERLVLYKRLLRDLLGKGEQCLYSHQLAELAKNTPAQVRRDLMTIGYAGSPRKGYGVQELIDRISEVLEETREHRIGLVGIGNLGRAILSYFNYKHQGLAIVAAFDSDPSRTDRVITGCRCFHTNEFAAKVKELEITIGVITVPADKAQEVADMMVAAGIKGVLNFAPVPLNLPEEISTDRIDITMALEKIAYFAGRK